MDSTIFLRIVSLTPGDLKVRTGFCCSSCRIPLMDLFSRRVLADSKSSTYVTFRIGDWSFSLWVSDFSRLEIAFEK